MDLNNDKFLGIIESFVQETDTDMALAMYYLQNCDFDLKKAIEHYKSNDHKVIGDFVVPVNDIFEHFSKFEVLSWNIEGLTTNELQLRIDKIIETINELEPEIIFFQEVVDDVLKDLESNLNSKYNILPEFDNESKRCFSMMMINKKIKLLKEHVATIPLSQSLNNRYYLVIPVEINKTKVKLITGHLESGKEYSEIRKKQLKQIVEEMKTDTDYAIFGGDTNLRDSEVEEMGCINGKTIDIWEYCDKRNECRFTWDPRRNINAEISCPHGRPSRFDRMWFYSNNTDIKQGDILPYRFGLEGLEKVRRGSRFPSDHWAILGHFYID